MNYKYDDYGWFAGITEDTDRVTHLAPPVLNTVKVVGELHPNYTGYEWIMLTYQVPPQHVPTYKSLTQLQFIELCQEIGGMTDELLVAAKKNPLLEAMWIKFNLAQEILVDDFRTTKGLEALEELGYLQVSAQYVIDHWPTV